MVLGFWLLAGRRLGMSEAWLAGKPLPGLRKAELEEWIIHVVAG
jgi:hypothetical protein